MVVGSWKGRVIEEQTFPLCVGQESHKDIVWVLSRPTNPQMANKRSEAGQNESTGAGVSESSFGMLSRIKGLSSLFRLSLLTVAHRCRRPPRHSYSSSSVAFPESREVCRGENHDPASQGRCRKKMKDRSPTRVSRRDDLSVAEATESVSSKTKVSSEGAKLDRRSDKRGMSDTTAQRVSIAGTNVDAIKK